MLRIPFLDTAPWGTCKRRQRRLGRLHHPVRYCRLTATPEFIDQIKGIREGIASGMSANAVAKELGMLPQQISRRLATATRVGI